MSDLGKIDREFFDEYVYPNLGAEREDVTLGPQHGVDFGVVDMGEQVAAMATDPVFVMPSLGFERAAWFAVHILLSDVAVSGLAPTHLSVDLNMPGEITDEQFATLWETFDREATELGVSIVTGHTGRYAGCNYPMIGGGTSIAVGDAADLVRPDGARPGDKIVITKGPAIEATGLLSIQFESLMQDDLDDGVIEDAKDRFYDMSPVTDALTAARAGPVSAMHDATEGGVHGGLYEMARAAGVGVEIERDAVPVQPGVLEACEFFGIDPWISISEGTLLAAVAPDGVDDVLAALDDEGIPAAEIGTVTDGSGLTVDGEHVDHPGHDPFWAAFEEHMGKLQDDA
ncbi:Hydrogenase maturation factor [Natronoarchaeum philippinense]|uniref:Hydrogenase maturation factor n=1 Tax=Natronoarchaeum philippinense TaxID=558529 RepID=A0A285NSL2_NATPI|nr:AIR synthase family protein [Natronoarchaeum philippinense]SNZ12484.1 Hydrogenase maturation factor [Natronoarchaeum philippinense]